MILAALLLLAVGTYGFRLAGPLLHGRFQPSAEVRRLLSIGAAVLLVALLATAALTQGHGFAGWARPAGVLAGAVLAWRKAPFMVVVAAAAATTALLRLAGVP
ncbi:AzlD domain-containing protein [Streptomyces sp. NA02950]|uniref:AzlD domain-containing protein n=1 Tax=Streptomyces sp. NA02950 TaxID=2742137 RepID=UPI001590A141|nr:AzlD domain-containing protein [Streptomyces sp. NA02950]QKV96752.1 AzlD domain-containing protein [Streptomyces sp. NA02950]